MATLLSSVNSTLLPPTVAGPIFEKTEELSAVQRLARRVPLSVSANTAVPVSMDIPAAGWVSEGGQKPVGSGAVGIKQMVGKKVALLVPVSSEVATTNPARITSYNVCYTKLLRVSRWAVRFNQVGPGAMPGLRRHGAMPSRSDRHAPWWRARQQWPPAGPERPAA